MRSCAIDSEIDLHTKITLLSPRRLRLRHWLGLVCGATLVLAALTTLWAWLTSPSREQAWRAIEKAAGARRWADAESGLRSWLRANPDDNKAQTMLGGLLFD